MKQSKIIIIAAIVLAALLAAIVVGLRRPQAVEVLQGQVETTDYRVSSKVPGRVLELRVSEGDHVRRGDTLAVLDIPDIDAKLAQATAAWQAAEAQQLKAQHGTRYEQVQGAYEQWQKAVAGVDIAEKTYQRVQRLYDQGVMAAQRRDEALAQRDAAVATERAARSQYDMAVAGARDEDKQAAAAQSARARGAISEVRSYVAEGILTATADGTVTEIFPEVGELVDTGAPIMNVATSDVWFTFNVREDRLPGLAVGRDTTVYLPAIDKRVAVRVTLLKDVGTFAAWKATKALDRYDLKTFEVQARPQQPVEGLRAGMTAIIEP